MGKTWMPGSSPGMTMSMEQLKQMEQLEQAALIDRF